MRYRVNCKSQWLEALLLLMAGYAAVLNASTLYPMRGRRIAIHLRTHQSSWVL